jgi:hypothetical protein
MHGGIFRTVSLALAALLAAGGCTKRAAPPAGDAPAPPAAPPAATLSVSGIELGKAIGADKSVAVPTTIFGTHDTIYASVATDGAPPTVTLAARWSFVRDGQAAFVDSTAQTIAPTGRAVTEFHISKPDGWPVGSYRIEVLADGSSVGTRDFEVR